MLTLQALPDALARALAELYWRCCAADVLLIILIPKDTLLNTTAFGGPSSCSSWLVLLYKKPWDLGQAVLTAAAYLALARGSLHCKTRDSTCAFSSSNVTAHLFIS